MGRFLLFLFALSIPAFQGCVVVEDDGGPAGDAYVYDAEAYCEWDYVEYDYYWLFEAWASAATYAVYLDIYDYRTGDLIDDTYEIPWDSGDYYAGYVWESETWLDCEHEFYDYDFCYFAEDAHGYTSEYNCVSYY